jgi:hypothetical protein
LRSFWAGDGAACDVGERGHAEVDGLVLALQGRVDLGELVLGAGEADLEALDLAEPAFAFGLGDAVVQVGPDLLEPGSLGGVRPQERAPDARIRCPLLRIDPAQRHRLEDIRDNLLDRIAEAEREDWAGEAEGLKVSLAAANNKLAQADLSAARRAEHVHLGIPAYRDITAATLTAPGDPHGH